MKRATPLWGLLLLAPALLSAQKIDFDAARSADQLRLGVQAFHRGAFGDAITALEKSISYQPGNVLAQTWLGRSQFRAGFEAEAQRTWQQIVDGGQGTPLLRDWISVLALRRGLGRELSGDARWVVSTQLDGMQKGGYPFRRPTSVRPRPDGSFWVVAFGSDEVIHFDANYRLIATYRGGVQAFDRPYDVAEAPDGTLFVSEYGANRVAKCSASGQRIKTFGTTGRGDGMLLGPQYLALDGRGYLWVTDWGNGRVERFDLDGNYVQAVSGIDGPTGVAVHNDRLYVSERSKGRILVYDLSGNALGSIGGGTLQAPEGI
ncbi:MAG TPA: NHL repeat-containing protein, partial [Spirochaetia bacterium]|nr:NHL repeat-containing protein [Spirochaetia bacterium]